jgi:uncharacterized membrane protein YfhO
MMAAEPQVIRFLREHIQDGRILNVGQDGALYPEYGAAFGIRQAGTMNAGLLPWYEQYFDKYFGNDTFFFLSLDGSTNKKRKKASRKTFDFDAHALDAASIKYIVLSKQADPVYGDNLRKAGYLEAYDDDKAQVFENNDYLPSLSLVSVLSTSTILHPHHWAITTDQKLLAQAASADVPVVTSMDEIKPVQGTVHLLSTANTEVQAEVNLPTPTVLVLSDVWHPSWRASVDGVSTYVGRVNEAFRGIVLPAGKHQVRFYYDSPALRYGKIVSWTSGALLCIVIVFGLSRRIKNARRTSNT